LAQRAAVGFLLPFCSVTFSTPAPAGALCLLRGRQHPAQVLDVLPPLFRQCLGHGGALFGLCQLCFQRINFTGQVGVLVGKVIWFILSTCFRAFRPWLVNSGKFCRINLPLAFPILNTRNFAGFQCFCECWAGYLVNLYRLTDGNISHGEYPYSLSSVGWPKAGKLGSRPGKDG